MRRFRRIAIAAALALGCATVACAPPPPAPGPGPSAPVLAPIDCAGSAEAPGVHAATGSGAEPADVPADDGPPGHADPLSGEELEVATGRAVAEAAADGSDVVTVVARVDGSPEIVDVPVGAASLAVDLLDAAGDVVAVEVPVVHRVLTTPDDPLFVHQWAFTTAPFHRTWPCGRGGALVVAVLDTGVQGTHPDLEGRVLGGYTKLGGRRGVAGTGNVDPHGHGTHVAGIIAAEADNGIGIAGVAPDVTVLPVRVLNHLGTGSSSDIADGINWAVQQGAHVINLSLGSPAPSAAMSAAISNAVANGVLVVAAAGNTGPGGAPVHPAADANTVAVASIASSGALSAFSTRAGYVDVAAPGSAIRSTCIGSTFCDLSGTSMAAPHVAGLAALVRSANPGISVAQLRQRLVDTANDAGPVGHDHGYGWGVIDPVEAVTGRPA